MSEGTLVGIVSGRDVLRGVARRELTSAQARLRRTGATSACHAPSLHNSQPWRWLLGPRTAHLYALEQPRVTDPSLRILAV